MIKPKENKVIHNFFTWYIKSIIKKDFKAFHYHKIEEQDFKDNAILLLANHTSWWDGFLLFYLNKLYFKKNFHVLILEETAKKVWFMKYLGAFSINKQSRSIVDSIDYAAKLLDDKSNLVLVFPEGRLYSSHKKNLYFEKGLTYIINQSKREFKAIFASILFDYFEERKPSVDIYLNAWDYPEYITVRILENEFNKHHEDAKIRQSKTVI